MIQNKTNENHQFFFYQQNGTSPKSDSMTQQIQGQQSLPTPMTLTMQSMIPTTSPTSNQHSVAVVPISITQATPAPSTHSAQTEKISFLNRSTEEVFLSYLCLCIGHEGYVRRLELRRQPLPCQLCIEVEEDFAQMPRQQKQSRQKQRLCSFCDSSRSTKLIPPLNSLL